MDGRVCSSEANQLDLRFIAVALSVRDTLTVSWANTVQKSS